MKRCLILIYMLGNILFAAADNTATKEALSVALKSVSSPEEKLETLTNLMDISRQEKQVDYAKQLYKEALANDNDYYKEAALTEILRFYVNNDIKDSTNVYMEEAKRELKGQSTRFSGNLYADNHRRTRSFLYRRRRQEETDRAIPA